jgi:hypothetical protein
VLKADAAVGRHIGIGIVGEDQRNSTAEHHCTRELVATVQ